MTIRNLEASVRNALKAYQVELGASEAEAATWANNNLQNGMIVVQQKLNERRTDETRKEDPTELAFEALKAWAQT